MGNSDERDKHLKEMRTGKAIVESSCGTNEIVRKAIWRKDAAQGLEDISPSKSQVYLGARIF